MAKSVAARKGSTPSKKNERDEKPKVSGKPGGNLQGGSGGSQNKSKKSKSGGGKA